MAAVEEPFFEKPPAALPAGASEIIDADIPHVR
jgi:hypothetical protein